MSRQNLKTVIGIFTIVSGMAFIFTCTLVPIPKENQRNADTGMIAVISLITMVGSSFFRTNTGENDKNNGTS